MIQLYEPVARGHDADIIRRKLATSWHVSMATPKLTPGNATASLVMAVEWAFIDSSTHTHTAEGKSLLRPPGSRIQGLQLGNGQTARNAVRYINPLLNFRVTSVCYINDGKP